MIELKGENNLSIFHSIKHNRSKYKNCSPHLKFESDHKLWSFFCSLVYCCVVEEESRESLESWSSVMCVPPVIWLKQFDINLKPSLRRTLKRVSKYILSLEVTKKVDLAYFRLSGLLEWWWSELYTAPLLPSGPVFVQEVAYYCRPHTEKQEGSQHCQVAGPLHPTEGNTQTAEICSL